MLQNILYENNGLVLCQLLKKYCEKNPNVRKTKQNRLVIS